MININKLYESDGEYDWDDSYHPCKKPIKKYKIIKELNL